MPDLFKIDEIMEPEKTAAGRFIFRNSSALFTIRLILKKCNRVDIYFFLENMAAIIESRSHFHIREII